MVRKVCNRSPSQVCYGREEGDDKLHPHLPFEELPSQRISRQPSAADDRV